ncbi:UvrD-helicase domain-containing protein [Hydrogenophaga palleronii]|uniref:UvrD-helicase domain-containing protein n=1 Tax=Hydrogenophaga palleronii TaxID=65655 RepID=UPI0008257BD9|nr:UvrD-helicase domain-containing protein [Hydrogenophaga palleronii]
MTAAADVLDDLDHPVDAEIAACLDLAAPRSFFLFAGAGSGKTRSLVKALDHVRQLHGETLRFRGQRVGVITFTNAACDEINRRLEFDRTIEVSTIHSFAWTLIGGLNHDIREWLRTNLAAEIAELEALEAKGRSGTKASAERISKIASKSKRLANLNTVRRFIYSPTGDNRGRDALNHSEVIKISATFLQNKSTMQSILVGRYPILLIDESQDTNKLLIDALFAVQSSHRERFALGLLGDMMQRIYSDGKEGLGQDLPSDWATPRKRLNHRCPKRVIKLINKIRKVVDGQEQIPRTDSAEGWVRLFILPGDTVDKPAAERAVAQRMEQLTTDEGWRKTDTYKSLTLEHRMAAKRMGFLEMFVALHEVESFRTGLLDGSLPFVRFFAEQILPLVNAQRRNDRFAVARIVRTSSPLLSGDKLRTTEDQPMQLRHAREAIDGLMSLWQAGVEPTFGDVLRNVASSGLFAVPDALRPNADRDASLDGVEDVDGQEVDRQTKKAVAIDEFLAAPFFQIDPYAAYVSGKAHFDTHQGVKGLEFPRVMVIMDDDEARGFLFSYAKLFGGKQAGDTSVESTRRLFYVTCSRAERSLALVAYSTQPDLVRQFVLREQWFEPDEVVVGIPN